MVDKGYEYVGLEWGDIYGKFPQLKGKYTFSAKDMAALITELERLMPELTFVQIFSLNTLHVCYIFKREI